MMIGDQMNRDSKDVIRTANAIVGRVNEGELSISDGRRILFDLALKAERVIDLEPIDEARTILDELDGATHELKSK